MTAKIKLNAASGGGSVSLEGPASSNADVEFKLPVADGSANQVLNTNASGTLSFVDGGTILQVKQAFKNDIMTSVSSSFVDLTGLSQSITVGTTGGVANKVLVMYNINSSGPGLVKDFNIVRGSTNLAQPADTSVARFATQSMFVNANHFLNHAFTFLDTPTAGTHTYKIQFRADGVNTVAINKYYSGASNYHSVSSFTLMEVRP